MSCYDDGDITLACVAVFVVTAFVTWALTFGALTFPHACQDEYSTIKGIKDYDDGMCIYQTTRGIDVLSKCDYIEGEKILTKACEEKSRHKTGGYHS